MIYYLLIVHSSTVVYMSHWDNLKAWHMLVDCHISYMSEHEKLQVSVTSTAYLDTTFAVFYVETFNFFMIQFEIVCRGLVLHTTDKNHIENNQNIVYFDYN